MKFDALLYILMALSTAVGGVLSTDEAAKYVDPQALWILRSSVFIFDGVVTALKAFTSRGFADWLEKKRNGIKTGDTEHIRKALGQNPS